jgi:hypothetical protein
MRTPDNEPYTPALEWIEVMFVWNWLHPTMLANTQAIRVCGEKAITKIRDLYGDELRQLIQ